jgi:hypothetical protein
LGTLWPNIRRCFSQCLASRRRVILLAIILFLGLGYSAILRLLTWPLVADDSSAECECFCFHGDELGVDGFEPFTTAAQWYHEQGGRKILLLLPYKSRIVEIGAVPSFEETCRRELANLGVPKADIESIPADALNVWDEARSLSDWMQAHPTSSVRLACSCTGGGRLRYVLHKVLAPADARRVHLAILADPGFSLGSWWRSRPGVKAFMYAWLELAYAWAVPGNSRRHPASAQDFQDQVTARIGEAP